MDTIVYVSESQGEVEVDKYTYLVNSIFLQAGEKSADEKMRDFILKRSIRTFELTED